MGEQKEIFFDKAESYREKFGYSLPKKAIVAVEYMTGMGWYILWVDATDEENVLYRDMKSKKSALEKVQEFPGWELKVKNS